MNKIAERFGDRKVAVLGFPCNQFGHQTNESNGEILDTLKHLRPGNGFEPADGVTLFEKIDVNGDDAHPLFKWMKARAPVPIDDADGTPSDVLVFPRKKFGNTTVALWSPIRRSDVAWNFEKFLIDDDGQLVKRYSRFYDTEAIANDIDAILT